MSLRSSMRSSTVLSSTAARRRGLRAWWCAHFRQPHDGHARRGHRAHPQRRRPRHRPIRGAGGDRTRRLDEAASRNWAVAWRARRVRAVWRCSAAGSGVQGGRKGHDPQVLREVAHALFSADAKNKWNPSYPGFCRALWARMAIHLDLTSPSGSGLPEGIGRAALKRLLLGALPMRLAASATVASSPVVSYTAVALTSMCAQRSVLCCAISQVALGGRYPPSCSVEPGSSSTAQARSRPSRGLQQLHCSIGRDPWSTYCCARSSPTMGMVCISPRGVGYNGSYPDGGFAVSVRI